jgi:hypothetical protein
MVHYILSYKKNWTSQERKKFIDELSTQLKIPTIKDKSEIPFGTDIPYIEYDDKDVRIRKMTHLSEEKQSEMRKKADEVYNSIKGTGRKRWICPVCNRDTADYPAKSRRDNKTKICSACGEREAYYDVYSSKQKERGVTSLSFKSWERWNELNNKKDKTPQEERELEELYHYHSHIQSNEMIENQIEVINYLKFIDGFKKFKIMESNNPDKNSLFIANIDNTINEAKIFTINDKQKQFLVSGRVNEGMEIKLPHNKMFLDVSFTKEELKEYGIKIKSNELIGLLITKGYVYSQSEREFIKKAGQDVPEKSAGTSIRLTLLLKYTDIDGEHLQFETFCKNVIHNNPNGEKFDEDDTVTIDKKAQDFWHNFFINFIRFVNFPELKFKEHKKTEKNIQRRIKQGRPVIPDYITVELTGILERYIDDFNEKPKRGWHYTYSFDVKGHYRNLTSPRYKNPKQIWVDAFRKGTGKYVPSIYKVNKRDNTDENKEM